MSRLALKISGVLHLLVIKKIMSHKKNPIILALDPGTKEMRIAVLDGYVLEDYMVKTFRNGRKPHELLGQAKETMVKLLEKYEPDVVVIEKPFFAKTKRSALLTFLVDELRIHARAGKTSLKEFEPWKVRKLLLGNPKATKREVAKYVIQVFPELEQHYYPGDFWKERYWSHVFDAVALGIVIKSSVKSKHYGFSKY